jgi:D-beta-D-heptose 7-phosphate kinase/D-beta-D-heptose 1-phosphate adenosyltransferase
MTHNFKDKTMQELVKTVKAMENCGVMVVGDIILDIFVYGDVERISPEGPVPVLNIQREARMMGGAGNVVTNLGALNAKSYIFSVVGEDDSAAQIRDFALQSKADITGIITDASRPTSVKTRYLARSQQLLRTDIEKTHALSSDIEAAFLAAIEKTMPMVKVVILSDYGKGVLTKKLREEVIRLAKQFGIPVLVDPKGQDFTIYKGANIITPNRKELSLGAGGLPTKTDDEVIFAANKIRNECGIANVVATRSEDGMSLIGESAPLHFKTLAREVFDVSGAGDTVIATIAASLAAGAELETAVTLANIAGGIVVGKVGTTPIRSAELLEALAGQESFGHQAPLQTWDEAAETVRGWKAKGLKVGFTNGCFDIVHYGHVNYVNHAREKCDRLIIGLNHDASVRLLKGPTRPVNDEVARATVIGALGAVDLVVLFGAEKAGDDNTPCALIENLQPDIFFKGGDYKIENLPEAKVVHAYGGEVAIMNLYEGYSTTGTIEKMQSKA